EGAIHHFHAKDTYIDPDNVNMYGLTDMQSYANMQERAWLFRTVGYGHDLKTWADILSALRLVGYDYVVSIEHEDALLSIEEGFVNAGLLVRQVWRWLRLRGMWWVQWGAPVAVQHQQRWRGAGYAVEVGRCTGGNADGRGGVGYGRLR